MRVAGSHRLRRLTMISVPFDLGVRASGVGNGPLELLGERALPARFRDAGYDVEVVELLQPSEDSEVGRVAELDRDLSEKVRTARGSGRVPLIFGGNCNVCLGALAGIDTPGPGIVWVDAHADFRIPDATGSGFFDGTDLAFATGASRHTLARLIPGLRPVRELDTVLVGVRDIDPSERDRLQGSEVTVIAGGGGPGSVALDELEHAVTALASRVGTVYLHVDLDSIDTSLGRANEHAVAGGLGIDDIRVVTTLVAERVPIAAVSFTAYDPDADPDGHFGETAVQAITAAAQAVLANPSPATDERGRGR